MNELNRNSVPKCDDEPNLHYDDMGLPENVEDILGRDFWIFDNVSAFMLASVTDPLKFTSSVSIFVRQGYCRAVINLQTYEMHAPAAVVIRAGEILQPLEVSPDFQASFIVMSKKFAEDIFLHINDMQNLTAINRYPVIQVPEDLAPKFSAFYESLHAILDDKENPNVLKVLQHSIVAFYYRCAHRCYNLTKGANDTAYRLSDRFLDLVQRNFKRERFLEFYANELGITPKHLSRTVKAQTGYSAVGWIERFLILESKVLLKSTNMTVQQISDSLNFPTQSFFGKYFKKNVGVSPKTYRNS